MYQGQDNFLLTWVTEDMTVHSNQYFPGFRRKLELTSRFLLLVWKALSGFSRFMWLPETRLNSKLFFCRQICEDVYIFPKIKQKKAKIKKLTLTLRDQWVMQQDNFTY